MTAEQRRRRGHEDWVDGGYYFNSGYTAPSGGGNRPFGGVLRYREGDDGYATLFRYFNDLSAFRFKSDLHLMFGHGTWKNNFPVKYGATVYYAAIRRQCSMPPKRPCLRGWHVTVRNVSVEDRLNVTSLVGLTIRSRSSSAIGAAAKSGLVRNGHLANATRSGARLLGETAMYRLSPFVTIDGVSDSASSSYPSQVTGAIVQVCFDIEKEAIQMQSNDDILEKDWKHLRSKVREHWHSLTDEDIDIINGSRSVLVSMLEEKYFYSKEIAEDEVRRFLAEITAKEQPMHATHVFR
jgi:uncharacterized protein YjbJ (UPF0337 family)